MASAASSSIILLANPDDNTIDPRTDLFDSIEWCGIRPDVLYSL